MTYNCHEFVKYSLERGAFRMLKRLVACLLALTLLAGVWMPAAFSDTLRSGSRGSEVVALQTALKNLGYYTKSIDGIYGKGTIAAVKSFQKKTGLKVDGVAGPKTLAMLFGEGAEDTPTTPAAYTALSSGARGSQVRALQTALKNLGYYAKSIDGIYGKGTIAAVKAFQSANGLKETGIADSKTQQALYSGAAQSSTTIQASPTSLRLGDRGEAVAALKQKLHYLGYLENAEGSEFDGDTQSAVMAYQKAKKLTRDGVAGKKTLSSIDSAYASAKKSAASLPDEAVSLLNRIKVESGAVCGTVVLSKNGKTFLSWSFGGVNSSTCFRIASVTKWVTAIGLMTLYDQGKLDLDRDISDYLPFTVRNPAYPNTPITARMLMSHTSSLSPNTTNYHPNWSRISTSYDPVFDESMIPGTKFVYADFNGALFGSLIEAITGESVQKYLNRTVFQPLGVTAAYTPKLLPSGTATKDLLTPSGGVSISVSKDRNRPFNNKADPAGNAGYTVGRLFINTASLTRLAQMMLNGGELNGVRILKRDTVALMEADQPGLADSKYGLSTVRLPQFDRGTWYGHQGRYSGLSSNVYYQRETGITLALVMNGYNYQLEDNVVMPAVTLLRNMEMLDGLCN